MGKLSLLWVDLTRSVREAELPPIFEDYFNITHCYDAEALSAVATHPPPHADVICFHFDYPDRTGLELVQQAKQQLPQIPMIMLTLQHSEALAVWAFRTRLWDYLVKPVARQEIERCANGLIQVRQLRESQRHRPLAAARRALPGDTAAPPRQLHTRLAPAINYVEKHFHEKIQSEEVAKLCSMSAFHFSRSFKEHFGLGFREFLLQYRLREACRLLNNPRASVTDVCYAVGFNDHSYFTRMFKRYFDVLPSNAVGRQAVLRQALHNLPSTAHTT